MQGSKEVQFEEGNIIHRVCLLVGDAVFFVKLRLTSHYRSFIGLRSEGGYYFSK